MQKSYTANYLRIYFWQILSIVLNLLSLFIVVPRLSAQPSIYGIYSICAASIIFLSYADLGFVNAGMKFASEAFARREKESEIRIVGLVSYILLLLVVVFMAVIIYVAIYPDLIIKNFSSLEERHIATQLLFTLAITSPNIVLQRALQIFFGIRLEDFVFQKIQVCSNVLKILSVYIFFTSVHYNVVGYFIFTQCATTGALLVGLFVARKRYNISIKRFIKAIRFSKDIYNLVKALAFNSLFVTISWILYYELDLYMIAKLSGAEAVAFYAIGLTCLSFFRTIFGTLFNPFTSRFNHFIALNEAEQLQQFYKTVIVILLPLVVFPVLSLVILSKPFVLSWVGPSFEQSITVVQLLVLSNVLAFISYPCGILLVAQQEVKMLFIIAALLPFIFWGTILILLPAEGFVSFAFAKFLVFIINGIVYTWFSLKFLQINLWQFLKKFIIPAVPPTIVLSICLLLSRNFLPVEKSKVNLLFVVCAGATASAIALMSYYFTAPVFRCYVQSFILKIRKFDRTARDTNAT